MKHDYTIKLETEKDLTSDERLLLLHEFSTALQGLSHPLLEGSTIRVIRKPTDQEIMDAIIRVNSGLKNQEDGK